MAEEKKTAIVTAAEKTADQATKAVKKASDGKLSKILNWFKTLPSRIVKPFKNMFYELKKVTWPSKKKLLNYSIIVLLFMLFMAIVIGLLDMGATALITLITPKAG